MLLLPLREHRAALRALHPVEVDADDLVRVGLVATLSAGGVERGQKFFEIDLSAWRHSPER